MNEINYLIISSTIDYSTDLICAELEKRKLSYLRINRDLFSEYDIVYDLQDCIMKITMAGLQYVISEEAIKSIYFRAPVFLRTTGKLYDIEEQLKRSQWSAFIRNLIVWDKALWINHPVATYRAENKLYQLKVAKSCGLNVPETYVGNTLPKSIDWKSMYIVKSLDTAIFYNEGKEMFTYSTMVSGQELLHSEIKAAPIIIQEYLSNKRDIRISVIGDCVFPVAITRQGKSIVGDWRKSSKENLDYNVIELPQAIEEKIKVLMNKLGLTFGGVDFAIVDDKYYFIEVNPTGEWGWLTMGSEIPIDKAIVDHMECGGTYE